MTASSNAPHLQRRKQILLRARPNLQITTRMQAGRRIYVVKDPVSLRFYHMEEPQRFLLEQMNGQRTLEEIRTSFEQQFKPQRLPFDELETFARHLLHCGLVMVHGAPQGELLLERAEKVRQDERLSTWLNIFFIKVPLFDPERLLTWLEPVGRLCFHPLALLIGLLLMTASGLLVMTRWAEFCSRLPTYQAFFSWQTVGYVWLALGLVKILHEMGHALCCKAVGGRVPEMGLAILFFFPTLYCNVTDAWLLPEKWKRIAISAAGIWVELLIASITVWVWWLTDPNTFLHNLSFALVLVCSVNTVLFNANPLMRFDGYFILSDWVEIPNLAQLASARVMEVVKRWLGMRPSPAMYPASQRFLLLYGLASFAYRLYSMSLIAYFFHTFMKEQRLAWVGVLLLLLGVMVLLIGPAIRLVKTIQQRGRVPEMKWSRVCLTGILLGCGVAIVVLVPFPLHVRAIALTQVEPDSQHRLTVLGTGGFLDQVFVAPGQAVRQGDVIATLKNPELERTLRLNEAEQALRRQQQRSLLTQLALFSAPQGEGNSIPEVEQELTNLVQQQNTIKIQLDQLTLRAPSDGVILSLPPWESRGKWMQQGEEFGIVGDMTALRAVLLVESADHALIKEGASAQFLSPGGGKVYAGSVATVSHIDSKAIPPQLSSRAGGDIATQQDPSSKTEKPFKQHFVASIRFQKADGSLQSGILGQVRIDAGSATLWWRLNRFLGSTLKGEL